MKARNENEKVLKDKRPFTFDYDGSYQPVKNIKISADKITKLR